MMSDEANVVIALQRRKTKFNPPVSEASWCKRERKIKREYGLDFKKVYRIGDGFINYDMASELRLWRLDEINANTDPDEGILNKSGWVAIGDFLIYSDTILSQIFESVSPVRLASQDIVLSASLADFLSELAAGRFDF